MKLTKSGENFIILLLFFIPILLFFLIPVEMDGSYLLRIPLFADTNTIWVVFIDILLIFIGF